MPHQCTTCGRTFPDGSKKMLSGCPDCGGNKFQFKPSGAADDDAETGTPDPAGSAAPEDSPRSPTDAGDPADATAESADVTPESADATPESADASPAAGDIGSPDDADGTEQISDRSDEDTAQASARSDVVSPDELDRASRELDETPSDETPEGDAPRSGVDALRDELNEQFESIRIVSPGQYELNLMELYDRQEYIISLQEDGRYVIEMPDAWDALDE